VSVCACEREMERERGRNEYRGTVRCLLGEVGERPPPCLSTEEGTYRAMSSRLGMSLPLSSFETVNMATRFKTVNMAHIRQSWLGFGLGFQVKSLEYFKLSFPLPGEEGTA